MKTLSCSIKFTLVHFLPPAKNRRNFCQYSVFLHTKTDLIGERLYRNENINPSLTPRRRDAPAGRILPADKHTQSWTAGGQIIRSGIQSRRQ